MFVLLMAAAILPSSASQAQARCDLEPWLSIDASPGEEGYHVLCATGPASFDVYRGGVTTDSPELLKLEMQGRQGLREIIPAFFGMKGTVAYTPHHNRPGGGQVWWWKQPWAMFTAAGEQLTPGQEEGAIRDLLDKGGDGVLLVFEGGVWRWPTIHIGYRREAVPGVWLRTVSRQPALFEVKIEDAEDAGAADGKLSTKLLTHVISLAEQFMRKSEMEGFVDEKVRSSDTAFLAYDSDPQLKVLQQGTSKLLRGTADHLEAFQVLRYQVDQKYQAHRDYWDPREFPDVPRFRNKDGFWHNRHATLLWYLAAPEQGGETWFPRAHGLPIPAGEWGACDTRGAMVSPANATAVLFYNLRADGEIDEFSWHAGCPVKAGVKWAANSWMSNSPGSGKSFGGHSQEL